MRYANRILVLNLEGKRLIGRSTRMWEDDIKKTSEGAAYECMKLIQVAQYKVWWPSVVNRVPERRYISYAAEPLQTLSNLTIIHSRHLRLLKILNKGKKLKQRRF